MKRARHRVRIWFAVKVVVCLCALGLAHQFASNLLSLHELQKGARESEGLVRVDEAEEDLRPALQVVDPSVEGDDGMEIAPDGDPPAGGQGEDGDAEAEIIDDEGAARYKEEQERARRRRARMKTRTLSELLALVEDPELFAKSEFGYPTDLIVVTQENMERLKSPSHYLSRPDRFLPRTSPFSVDPEEKSASRYGTCALVGNAGIARAAPFGESIDKHDIVMRINQGPSKGYEKNVGSRTSFRLLNKKWASMYTSREEGRKIFLPTEAANATILASRISTRAFEHLASVVRHSRKDLSLLYVAQGLESRARNLLKAFKNASMHESPPVTFEGGDAPSSGFIGFYFLLQICERVAVYAFSSQKLFELNKRNWPYHYFRFNQFVGAGLHLDSEQLREHPHHSFDAEVEFMATLSARTNRTVACIPRGQFTRSKLMKCGVYHQDEEL